MISTGEEVAVGIEVDMGDEDGRGGNVGGADSNLSDTPVALEDPHDANAAGIDVRNFSKNAFDFIWIPIPISRSSFDEDSIE